MADTDLTRPIIGIENRTAQEVFDIMCDRFRRAPSPSLAPGVVTQSLAAAQRVIENIVQYAGEEGRMAYDDNGDDDWFVDHGDAALKLIRAALASLSQPAKGEGEGGAGR